jgi:transcriptional regulator with XRE-family HTH domain
MARSHALPMRTFHNRAADVGRDHSLQLARRFGIELRIARVSAGLTQRQLAHRSGVSQQAISRVERGDVGISLEARCRLAAGAGHELGLRLYPVSSIRLRDSGQLKIAEAIAGALDPSWTARMEVPVRAGDLRAADLLLSRPDELVQVEIERSIVDLQAQLRAGQIKRQMLAEGSPQPVRLVIAVPDSLAARSRMSLLAGLLAAALPIPSRRIAAALRSGQPVGGDGMLFVRAGRLITRASAR